eukprot:TRINITY_DN14907_c0_g1_i2.p1 TRINITY_DN14907_c0_g1~~TRINITY_DN14907_c0_g1_i2.p1  ORF type:complete len:844 (-),score=104.25 TRINITY_DN14907_c0_g1_i2:146-2677(-)
MKKTFGSAAFDFLPETFVLPYQVEDFLECYEKTKKKTWICKPHASSRGRGIFLLKDLKELPLQELSVVSTYIDRPYLIQGLKFDLRVYVLVTSFEPLRAYVFREGLTRFASKPYSSKECHLNDSYRHLTNYSINKKAPNFQENSDLEADNVGHKWSLSALNRHLEHSGVDVELLWTHILDLIAKTLIAVEPPIRQRTREISPSPRNPFEVYGFDILLDDKLKPWLIEVNLSPSMETESPLDWHIKSSLLSDVLNLAGVCFTDNPRERLDKARSSSFGARNDWRLMFDPAMVDPRVVNGMADSAIPLNALSEEQLRMLSDSLLEQKRCSKNFIRLYPTRATVKRYAYITDMTFASATIQLDTTGCRLSHSQLLASVMFGKRPVFSRSLSRSRSQPLSSTLPASRNGDGRQPCVRNEEIEEAFHVLGTRAGSQLLFMEYLIRLARGCSQPSGIRAECAEKLRPVAARLSSFSKQLINSSLPQHGDVDEHSDLLSTLKKACRSRLVALATEVWISEDAGQPQASRFREARTLQEYMPAGDLSPEFLKAVYNMSQLSNEDIEHSLLFRCDAEFRSLLEFYMGGNHKEQRAGMPPLLPSDMTQSGWQNKSRKQREGRRGPTCGPLLDVLRASQAVLPPLGQTSRRQLSSTAYPSDTFRATEKHALRTVSSLPYFAPHVVPWAHMQMPGRRHNEVPLVAIERANAVLARHRAALQNSASASPQRGSAAVRTTTSLPPLRKTEPQTRSSSIQPPPRSHSAGEPPRQSQKKGGIPRRCPTPPEDPVASHDTSPHSTDDEEDDEDAESVVELAEPSPRQALAHGGEEHPPFPTAGGVPVIPHPFPFNKDIEL